jgi:GNAT superfamily N-acetyltransferase
VSATDARIALRPATSADLPQIGSWYAEAAALACSDRTLDERLHATDASEGELLLIAKADDPAPIGLLQHRIGFPDKGWLAIDFLALAAGRRGWGYGSEAVRLVEESAGATRFLAEVDARNGLALYFWLRLGYRPLRPDEVFWRAPDEDGIIAMVREGM